MADIKLKIEVNPNAETETLGNIVNKVGSTATNSNVANTSFKSNSSTGVFTLPSGRVDGINGLSMASSNGSTDYDFIFNDSDNLDNPDGLGGIIEDETNPKEFIWGIVPANKSYSVKLTFTNATTLKDVVVLGDTVVNQFPTEAIIDGTTTIYSDDPKWAINMGTESSTHTIEFTKWNRANYNACLSNIRVTLRYLELDKGWIDNVESLSQSTSDASSIQYGALANSGSANIRDLDGEFKDLVADGVLPVSDAPIGIYVNGNKIQQHITSDSSYKKEDKMLSLEFTNSLKKYETLSEVQFPFLGWTNAYYVLWDVFIPLNFTISEIDDMLSSTIIYGNNQIGSVKEYLENIEIEYYYRFQGSRLDTINKICNIAQLQVFQNNNGDIRFISARPIARQAEINNAISIPKAYRISNLKDSIILKNKYNGIEAVEDEIVETPNDVVYSSNMLYCCADRTYIGNNPGVNESQYDVYGGTTNSKNWFQFNLQVDLQKTGKLSNSDFDDLKIRVYPNKKNFLYKNGSFTNDTYPGSGDFIELKYYPNYTEWIHYQLNNFGNLNAFSASIDLFDGTLNVIAQVCWSPDMSNAQQNVNYSVYFIQDFTFSILKSTYEPVKKTISTGTDKFKIEHNELQQTETKFDDVSILNVIGNNIASDYANGVSDAKIDIFCGDLYNSSNTKVKNWANGEILEIGDIVYFDDDLKADQSQRYWRVTGRTFKYSGAPTLSLELQEIVRVV